MEKVLGVFKSLSDETRLRIINLLYEQELCVCDIMETLKITQAKASRHLIYLKNAGLAKDRKHAQWVYYSICKDEHVLFLDPLIYEIVRNNETFRRDIENLYKYLAQKKLKC